jgi:hypothetical protein
MMTDKKIGQRIVVDIAPRCAPGFADVFDPGSNRNVLETNLGLRRCGDSKYEEESRDRPTGT